MLCTVYLSLGFLPIKKVMQSFLNSSFISIIDISNCSSGFVLNPLPNKVKVYFYGTISILPNLSLLWTKTFKKCLLDNRMKILLSSKFSPKQEYIEPIDGSISVRLTLHIFLNSALLVAYLRQKWFAVQQATRNSIFQRCCLLNRLLGWISVFFFCSNFISFSKCWWFGNLFDVECRTSMPRLN